MSVFSDMLKNFVHEKDINVAALAHYCELERSTVYKFINGKREPMSAELVDRIAHFLKLTPSEILHLQEAWKMARMGEDVYYTRKSVEHFLCDFPSKSVIPAPVFSQCRRYCYPILFIRQQLRIIEFQTGNGFCCSPDSVKRSR